MPELSIHLRETFNDDALVIRVNGVERRRLDGVTTRLLLGYAEIVGEELAEGPNLVEIELQSKGRSASVQIDGSQDAHLEVWYAGGVLTLRIPPEPPAYL